MTLGNVIEQLRNRLDDKTDNNRRGEFDDTELIVYINQALSWFCRVLKNYKETTTGTISAISTDSEQIGKATVSLPTNAFDIESVVISWQVTNTSVTPNTTSTIYSVLKKRDKNEVEDIYPIEGCNGEPRYFYRENKLIGIYPILDNKAFDYSIRFNTIQRVGSRNDVLCFTEEYDTPFLDACEYFARRTRPTVEANLSIAQGLYSNVVNFFNERGKVVPQQAGVIE